jgi:hypothetical protein
VKLRLQPATNQGGTKYSEVVVEVIGSLDEAQAAIMAQVGAEFARMFGSMDLARAMGPEADKEAETTATGHPVVATVKGEPTTTSNNGPGATVTKPAEKPAEPAPARRRAK